jgi:peptidoglycan/LPS O-acetylase OafA/YrhL
MPDVWTSPVRGSRDLRIDWLRGLAMSLVIVNHSRMSSLLSWFSYERFWVVTAAEVFVVLSGVVLGMVYGRRLARNGWQSIVRGLGRRALLLYASFVAVTVSIVILSLAGIDVSFLTGSADRASEWFLNPRAMDAAAWRDVVLMHSGPWPFEIVGLYVWLVAAAIPCLLILHVAGWRPLLTLSWALFFVYRIAPHELTSAEFEEVFPLLAWQLLFVHGIAIGYHREQISTFVSRYSMRVPIAAASVASALFIVFACCNPAVDGPGWLHWRVISPDRFTDLYGRYFNLSDLGAGRLINLAIGLPLGYQLLTLCWGIARRLQVVFVTLGQQSLGAFVLHVYGLLLIKNLPQTDDILVNALLQVTLIVAIAAALSSVQRFRIRQTTVAGAQPLAA